MKLLRRISALLLMLISILVGMAMPAAATPMMTPENLSILFTHDMHDHFLPAPAEGGGEYGGFVRLATALERERAKVEDESAYHDRPVITLDAGDFSMGSLFQTIYSTDAPELRAMGAMGYDVTTLGNHEFDYRQRGLADMLNAAKESGDRLPAIVQANYTVPQNPETGAYLTQALENYGVSDYTIIEREGWRGLADENTLRIAVFGVMGVDADASAPMSEMEFEPIAQAARRVVAEIQERERADYIICLSHSGLNKNPKKSEDEQLAKAVDGIDVIISGHTHSTLEEPILVNDTILVSCGPYTENLGVLTVGKSGGDGSNQVVEYRLVPIDETVAEDPKMAAMARDFQQRVSRGYLRDYGMRFDQVLAQSPFDFTPIGQLGEGQEEDTLGNLIADSYIYAVKETEGEDYEPVDFAVVAAGVVRASFAKGEITTSDVFNVSSLGVGADGTPGYPLISVYITGKELKDAFEVDASVTPIMPAAQLWGAGMTWTFNPNRMIFNKVVDAAQVLEDGNRIPIEEKKLYRVVTGLYSGQMLGEVNGKSFGILTVTPKDRDGNPIVDFEQHIIRNQNGSELKEWYALASYLESQGTVSQAYAQPQGRKVIAPSWSPIELLKSPNWVTLTALGIALVLLAVAALVVRRVIFGRRDGRSYRSYRGR